MRVLIIDVGGTHIKVLLSGEIRASTGESRLDRTTLFSAQVRLLRRQQNL